MANHFLREWSDDARAVVPEPHYLSDEASRWDALDDLLDHLDEIDRAIEAHELALASTRATGRAWGVA